jgi:hypothetical protein
MILPPVISPLERPDSSGALKSYRPPGKGALEETGYGYQSGKERLNYYSSI